LKAIYESNSSLERKLRLKGLENNILLQEIPT
jgi:hypothetical protein